MRRRMKIGLVTYKGLPELTPSDRLFIPLFAERRLKAEPVVWSDPPAFARWLDRLATLGVETLNPLRLLRQNQHKFYLRGLERNGIRIIPTHFIERTEQLDLSAVRDVGWAKAVIKPAISANSYFTELFDVDDQKRIEQKYQTIAGERDLLVQEFMPEIQRFGEISLVFINRRYSHAILKSAGQKEFRVQAEYGGQSRYFRARRAVVEEAETILDQFPGDILYARVDGVVRGRQFYLMEIELTDPELYFDHCPDARESFVAAAMKLSRGFVE
jgi:glutathione synthase/RimK-type ligase-like ATP-grasp enzyme